MRKLLFLFAFLLVAALPAQDSTAYAAIADRLATYAKRSMAWDVDGLLDLTDPELFEVIPRESMHRRLSGLRSDENMTVTVSDFTIDDIGEMVPYGKEAFVPITCHHRMSVTLNTAPYREKSFRDRLTRMLQKSHGSGKVRSGEAPHTLIVEVNKSMFAVRRGTTANWYFIEYRPDNAALLDLLLPPVVRALVGLE